MQTVFVSYSHEDEAWKDRVVAQLNVLAMEGVLDVWEDRRIAAGDAWRPEIEAALNRAAVAVLLISPSFLTSRFIRDNEIPRLLERRTAAGVRMIPVFVHPCPWQAVDWLAALQGRPGTDKTLSELRRAQAEKHLAALALEIQGLLATAPRAAVSSSSLQLDIGRLPTSGPHFVGRDEELARFDAAWEDPSTHVLTFVAFGGVGKSALVGRWLDGMAADGWRGARRVLDWSFYSQGTEERVTSADRFLDHTLRFFGDPDPKAGAPRDRGLRLAELVRQEKTLLVLDGVEPLQHPPGHPLAGQLKDPALAALLKSLAGSNPGLCVVTTRERIADLESFPKTAPQVDLETLSPEAGAELLKQLGVKGKDSELWAASAERL